MEMQGLTRGLETGGGVHLSGAPHGAPLTWGPAASPLDGEGDWVRP